MSTRAVPTARGIRRDDLIILTGVGTAVRRPYLLRRIKVVEPTTWFQTIFRSEGRRS